jgi:hypothetical protein
VAGETGQRVRCGGCGELLDERTDVPVSDRTPCPCCGSRDRRTEVDVEASIPLRSSLTAKGRRSDARRPFLEQLSGADFSHRLGRWMDKFRRIDRDHDKYDEVVTDPETGDVVHETHERLSEHRRYGSARPRRDSNGGGNG